jgi:tetratricopeptide (TPR) repeat protein
VKGPVSRGGCFVLVLLPCLLAQVSDDTAQKVAALEQQVQRQLQEQKPQLAIPLLRQVVSLDPGNVNAQANLGVLLFFQGSYRDAIPPMRAALQLHPELSRIQALLGMAEKRTGNPQQAEQDLERAFPNLDDKKIQVEAGLELVELHVASGQLDRALAVAARLQELAPQNPQILLAQYQISRQMMYQSLLGMMMVSPDSAEMRMIMGGELGRQGDRTAAIAQYRQAIRLNPKLPGVHYELAELLRSSSDAVLNAQADEEYKAAVRINLYDILSWRRLGEIASAKGDFSAAEEHYEKALSLQPKDSDAKTGLAIVFISTNRITEAISLLEDALKDDPANLVAHYRLSGLYRRAGRTADAEREIESFRHYQDPKDQLGKVFKQLAAPGNPK